MSAEGHRYAGSSWGNLSACAARAVGGILATTTDGPRSFGRYGSCAKSAGCHGLGPPSPRQTALGRLGRSRRCTHSALRIGRSCSVCCTSRGWQACSATPRSTVSQYVQHNGAPYIVVGHLCFVGRAAQASGACRSTHPRRPPRARPFATGAHRGRRRRRRQLTEVPDPPPHSARVVRAAQEPRTLCTDGCPTVTSHRATPDLGSPGDQSPRRRS